MRLFRGRVAPFAVMAVAPLVATGVWMLAFIWVLYSAPFDSHLLRVWGRTMPPWFLVSVPAVLIVGGLVQNRRLRSRRRGPWADSLLLTCVTVVVMLMPPTVMWGIEGIAIGAQYVTVTGYPVALYLVAGLTFSVMDRRHLVSDPL